MAKSTLSEFGQRLPSDSGLPWIVRLLRPRRARERAIERARAQALSRLRLEQLSLLDALGMLLEDETPERALRALSDLEPELALALSEQARLACRFALGASELPDPSAAEREEWLPESDRLAWSRFCADLRDGLPLSAPPEALQGGLLAISDVLNSLRTLGLADWPSKVWGAAVERESIELALEWPDPALASAGRKSRARSL